MIDPIMKELWEIKDQIARGHGYDIDSLIARLRSKSNAGKQKVVDLRALKSAADPRPVAGADRAQR